MKNNIKIRKIRFFNWYRSLDAIIGYSMYTSEEVRISRRFSYLVLSTDQKDKVVKEVKRLRLYIMVLLLRGYHEAVLIRLTNPDGDSALDIRHTPFPPHSVLSLEVPFDEYLKGFSLVLSLISARTYKHGGFCLKTGAPQRGKSSFSLKRVW